MTPSVERIRTRFRSIASNKNVCAGHLVLAIVADESLGGQVLRRLGLTMAELSAGIMGKDVAAAARELSEADDFLRASDSDSTETLSETDAPAWVQSVFDRAVFIARRGDNGSEVSSQHLLEALFDSDIPTHAKLHEAGVSVERVRNEMYGESTEVSPLSVDFELTEADLSQNSGASTEMPVLPLIDANLNRAREGLRVLEDYARFVARDAEATEDLKQMRHDLVAAELRLAHTGIDLRASRSVENDVGTGITTAAEMQRESLHDVVTANARRVQESLRSLEEFGKTVCGEFAASVKQMRYRSYALEQRITTASSSHSSPVNFRDARIRRLQRSFLYVLVTEKLCRLPWKQTVSAALRGGADIIQLREKELANDELLTRARWMISACREADALFILNDRPDLAAQLDADGVHIGQEDGAAVDARQNLNPDQLLGVSTHNVDQLKAACRVADYVGVGPVFPSQTKTFDEFAGTKFVTAAAKVCSLPWFAIGGITAQNTEDLQNCGATRIAVSAAVVGHENAANAAATLRDILHRVR